MHDPCVAVAPMLDGALVALRDLSADDLEPLARLLAMPTVTRYQLTPPPGSRQALADWIKLMAYRRAERMAFAFAVTIRGASPLVGLGQLVRRPSRSETEWGCLLAPSLWGTGAFADTCGLLRRFAREALGVSELTARTARANRRAIAALYKIGARPTSTTGMVTVWQTSTDTAMRPAGDAPFPRVSSSDGKAVSEGVWKPGGDNSRLRLFDWIGDAMETELIVASVHRRELRPRVRIAGLARGAGIDEVGRSPLQRQPLRRSAGQHGSD